MRLSIGAWLGALCLTMTPAVALAQAASLSSSRQSETPGEASNVWLVAGGAFATIRGDCQECEQDFPYRHSGAVLANIGYRVNRRMDVGAEVYWMPMETAQGRVRTTHIDAIAQFRPWASPGFFLKGGAGMGFVRNWVDTLGSDSFNGKALSIVIGGGWAFRPAARVGFQLFATQHALALGDLQSADGQIPDVIGNRWSLGAAVVIR